MPLNAKKSQSWPKLAATSQLTVRLHENSDFSSNSLATLSISSACYITRHAAVNRQETEKLLYEYRRMTSKTLDRSTFRDLLHGTFGLTDDLFMDRGALSFAIITDAVVACLVNIILHVHQFSELLTKTTTVTSVPRSGCRGCLCC